MADTRTARDVYAHEMTEQQHREFINVAKSRVGYVMISGYASEMYDRLLRGWKRHVFNVPNNSAGGKLKRRMEEVVWCNF